MEYCRHLSIRASLGAILYLFVVAIGDARASGLPSFPDPGLQACFDEQAAANGWQSPDDVVELHCPERNIWTLSGIEVLTGLQVLDVSDNRLQDVYPLFAITTLKRLYLSGNRALQAYDLTVVFGMNRGLTHIGLRDIVVEELAALSLYDYKTGNPYPLVELDLRNTGVRFVYHLNQFPSLEVLDLSDNDLYELGGLQSLVSLRSLDLSNNRIGHLYELQNSRDLTELRLSGNRDLEFVEINWLLMANPGLSRLALAEIPIPDLRSLQLFNVQTGEPYALVELDLSDTGIPDAHALTQFPSLRRLSLAGNELDDDDLPGLEMLPELTSLDLSRNRLRNLVAIRALQHLTELRLSGNSGIDPNSLRSVLATNHGLSQLALADIPLGSLLDLPLTDPKTGLRYPLVELDVSNTGLRDIYPISEFPRLQVLNLGKNYISDIYWLNLLVELRELDLSDNRIRQLWLNQTKLTRLDLGGNRALRRWDVYYAVLNNPLTHLGLSDIPIEELSSLPLYDERGRYRELLELDLSNTGIRDISLLFQFRFLERLDLADNRISEIFDLQELERLKALDLSRTRVRDLWSLWNLRRLRELRLNGNPDLDMYIVRDIIRNNPTLECIDLGGLPVSDLWSLPLDDMRSGWPYSLVELDLSSTGISDIERLVHFPNLRSLNVSRNALQLVSALSLSPRLESLDLSHNPSIDVSQLSQATRLLELDLSGNSNLDPFWLRQLLSNNRNLRRLRLRDIPIQDLWSLPLQDSQTGEPYRLVELDVSNTQIDNGSLDRLRDFVELEILSAAGNSFTSLDAFYWPPYEHLRQLDLGRNQLAGGLNGLRGLTTLTHLNLSGNPALDRWEIYDLLSRNPSLTHLDLSGLSVQEDFTRYLYDPYTGLPYHLEKLGVAEAELTELATLSALPFFDFLLELDLHGNHLQQVAELGPLFQLRRLDLSDNELSSIEGLTALKDLERLSLSGNPSLPSAQVELVLENNKGLTDIGLSDIPIPDLSVLAPLRDSFAYLIFALELDNTKPDNLWPLTNQPKLQVLSLRDNDLVDVLPLFSLQYLTRLDLRGNDDIPCVDLDSLEAMFRPGVVIRPDDCFVPNTPPEVEILSPIEGARFRADENVVLEARATDAEDGDLSSRVDWFSNISGRIGSGKTLTVRLRAGNHELTAHVSDSRGLTATSVVHVVVDPVNPRYCPSRGQYSNYEWIQSVSLGAFSNPSGNNGGYGAYTGLGPISLPAGGGVVLRLAPGFPASAYVENWNVWIDYNRDGVFALEEKVFSGVSSTVLTSPIAVPMTAVAGPTRMRVSMGWGALPGACETFTWGEVEDYTVTIVK